MLSSALARAGGRCTEAVKPFADAEVSKDKDSLHLRLYYTFLYFFAHMTNRWGYTRRAAIRPNKHQRTGLDRSISAREYEDPSCGYALSLANLLDLLPRAISQNGQNRKFSVCGSEKSVWHSILSGKFYQESAGTKPENGASPANVLGLLGLIAARLV
jgi:hypothetical protein